jgi:uracil-DNA glycosylase family 4
LTPLDRDQAFRSWCIPCGLHAAPQAEGTYWRIGGDGRLDATLVLVGEAPGEEEEKTGRYFQGRAGSILDRALIAAGIDRESCYITNGVACRPRNAAGRNRTPTTKELGFCRGYLQHELRQLTQKKVLVALGASATWSLLHPDLLPGGVMENQGRVVWSNEHGCWIVLTVHPALALRKAGEIETLTDDLVKAARIARVGYAPAPMVPYTVVKTWDQAVEVRDACLAAERLSWDWETKPAQGASALHLTKAEGFLLAVAVEANHAWLLPRYGSEGRPVWGRWLPRFDQEILAPILTSKVPKAGLHVAFDCAVTKTTLGVWPEHVVDDLQRASHLVDNHRPERAHGLKRLVDRYTDYGRYDDALDKWLIANGYTSKGKGGKGDKGQLWRAPDEVVHPYAAMDAAQSWGLVDTLRARLDQAGLVRTYEKEEMPLILDYAVMDRRGLRINAAKLRTLSSELAEMMAATHGQIETLIGRTINLDSYPQVSKLLFDDLGLPILTRTQTGAASTAEDVLAQLATLSEIPVLLLHYRAYSKLKGSFVDGKDGDAGILAAVDEDGRARMSTILSALETHRLATRKPFPIHTFPKPIQCYRCLTHGRYVLGKSPCCPAAIRDVLSIRSVVVADEGYTLIKADFKQQEFMLVTLAAKAKEMEIALLDRGEDAHEYVMAQLMNKRKADYCVPSGAFIDLAAQVEYEGARRLAKALNFGLLYLCRENRLAKMLKCDVSLAAGYIADYYARLEEIKFWQMDTIAAGHKAGRAVSLFHDTYRVLPGLQSTSYMDVAEAERMLVNYPIQEGGRRVMTRGLTALARRWRKGRAYWQKSAFPAEVLFTVHDEVIAQARTDVAEEAQRMMNECLEQVHPELIGGCGIPRGLPVESKQIPHWG